MCYYLLLFHRLFSLDYAFTYAVENPISNRKYLLELIRRSKVYPRNMSREHGLNIEQ